MKYAVGTLVTMAYIVIFVWLMACIRKGMSVTSRTVRKWVGK